MEEKVYGYNDKTNSWHCTMCGEDMGEQNPRQLCCKTYCPNATILKRKSLDILINSERQEKKSNSQSPKERDILQFEEDIAWDLYIIKMPEDEERKNSKT